MPQDNFVQRRVIGLVFVVLTAIHPSCFRTFYKVAENPSTATPNTVSELQDARRYFILRSRFDARQMRDISLSSDQKTLQYALDTVPYEHRLHLRGGHSNGNLQYKKSKGQREVLNEVHLFVERDNLPLTGTFTIPLDSFSRMEVIQKDRGRTTVNHVLSGIGVAVSAFAIVGLIAVMTSCPFVSAYDGKDYILQGELYAGAVYPQLSRNDYVPLHLKPTYGHLSLRISNDLKEYQHIDVAKLITIEHKNDIKIMNDQQGRFYSITTPVPVASATAGNRQVKSELYQKDYRFFAFDDSLADPEVNALVLQFNKPNGSKNAKLILSLKNTFWLDRIYSKMSAGLGRYYNTYVAQQRKQPPEVLENWIKEQEIPMKVSVKDESGWKLASSINTVGPMAVRDLIVPIDIPSSSEDLIEIRLSTGFHFWEIDYAALDYSVEEAFSIHESRPVSASTEAGMDVTAALSESDGIFNDQLFTGAATTIFYDYRAPAEGSSNSYFLLSKGYYEPVRDFSGKPDVAFLQQFRKPGALARYSAQLYKKDKPDVIAATTSK